MLNLNVSVRPVQEGFRDNITDYVEDTKKLMKEIFHECAEAHENFPVLVIVACNRSIEQLNMRFNSPYLITCSTEFCSDSMDEVNDMKNTFVSMIRKLVVDGDAFAVFIGCEAWVAEMTSEEHEKHTGSIAGCPNAKEILVASLSRPGFQDRSWYSEIKRENETVTLTEYVEVPYTCIGRFANFFNEVN